MTKIKLILAVLGSIIGFIYSMNQNSYGDFSIFSSHIAWLGPLSGAICGFFIITVIRFIQEAVANLGVTEFKLPIPGLGDFAIKVDNKQKQYIWNIFVELSTRITTATIDNSNIENGTNNLGSFREALSSMYTLFSSTRGELKSMPPSPPPAAGCSTLESYVFILIKNELRPFLSQWHSKLKEWESTGMPENQWPLAQLFKEDLEITQERILFVTHQLGQALNVSQLNKVLSKSPDLSSAKHHKDNLKRLNENIASTYEQLASALSSEIETAGWRIYVELRSACINDDSSDVTNYIHESSSLRLMIKRELKRMTPTPPTALQSNFTVGGIALSIQSHLIDPVLLQAERDLKNTDKELEATTIVKLKKHRAEIEELTQELGKLISAPQNTNLCN